MTRYDGPNPLYTGKTAIRSHQESRCFSGGRGFGACDPWLDVDAEIVEIDLLSDNIPDLPIMPALEMNLTSGALVLRDNA